jgi:tape measure domain-containing protein
MTDERFVDFRIRAKNDAKGTFDSVRKEVKALGEAIEEQAEASKRGEGSIKSLAEVYKKLESTMDKLVNQKAVVDLFESQQQALKQLHDRLGAASVALREHQQIMEQSETISKKQLATEQARIRAVEKAEKAVVKQAERIARTQVTAEELGISLSSLNATQESLASTSREIANTYNRLNGVMGEFTGNVEAARAAEARRLQQQKEIQDQLDATQKQREADIAEETRLQNALYEMERRTAQSRMDAIEQVRAAEARASKDRQKVEADLAARQQQAQQSVAEELRLQNALYDMERRTAQARADAVEAGQRAAAIGEKNLAVIQKEITARRALEDSQRQSQQVLNDMANKAIAAARGYTTLADASQRLVQNSKPLAATLRAIADPAGAVRVTMGGLEENVRSLASAVNAATGPLKNYREQVAQLAEAQKAAIAQGAAIDAYQKQAAVLRTARAEFVQARAAVLQYANSIRTAGEPTAQMQADMKRLEASLEASAERMQMQLVKTRELRNGLREAGVDTSNLAAAQGRLVQTATQANAALTKLNEQYRKHGVAVKDAAQGQGLFADEGRTTLSMAQRLRGEILALATAYFGLQGTINLAADSLDALNTKTGLQNQISIGVGNDPAQIAQEYAYIREQAERIGVAFEDAAKGYARFSAAASLAGRDRQEIRYVAETFLEVGQVANLTADEVQGVFKALEQVYSKGKIQAEELRGQLGDRLFGAFEIAAAALAEQFPDLNKAMENGQVTSEQLLAIAEQYRKTVGDQLPTAMESLRAQQNRLNSAMFDFKVLIAESGFAEDYKRLIMDITTFLRSSDGQQFAKNISEAFSAIVDVLEFVLENLDLILSTMKILGAVWAAGQAAAFAESLVGMVTWLKAANVSVLALAKGMGALKVATSLAAAAFIGWEIGSALYKESKDVQAFGAILVTEMAVLAKKIEFAFRGAFAALSTFAEDRFDYIVNRVKSAVNDILDAAAAVARAAGQEGLADVAVSFKLEGVDEVKGFHEALIASANKASAAWEESRKELQKEVDAIRKIQGEMLDDIITPPGAGASNRATGGVATASPGTKGAGAPGLSEAEIEKANKRRLALAEQLANNLAAVEAKIARNEKLSLDSRLEAIDIQYQKLYNDIAKLEGMAGGDEQAAAYRAQLDAYIPLLKAQETAKFNTEEMARKEQLLNDQIALRTQLLQTNQVQLEAGAKTEIEAKETIAEIDARMVPIIQASADASMQWAQANAQLFATPEAQETYIAQMQAIKDGTVATKNELLSAAQANEMLASGGTQAIDNWVSGIAQGESVIGSLKKAFLGFAADFLKKIALMIIQQKLLNAISSSGAGGGLSDLVNAAVAHEGAVVGHAGNGGVRRSVPAYYFANAPRYHSGGAVGLRSDEYQAILKKNEEVLTDDDPRNILNMGKNMGGDSSAAQVPQEMTVANFLDMDSMLQYIAASPKYRKVFVNMFQMERSEMKALFGGPR